MGVCRDPRRLRCDIGVSVDQHVGGVRGEKNRVRGRYNPRVSRALIARYIRGTYRPETTKGKLTYNRDSYNSFPNRPSNF